MSFNVTLICSSLDRILGKYFRILQLSAFASNVKNHHSQFKAALSLLELKPCAPAAYADPLDVGDTRAAYIAPDLCFLSQGVRA
jgi:hypothetical protein